MSGPETRTAPRDGPVFVVGCARSGTTLLYHALVSSGGFVDYRAETHFYDKLLPTFGPFSSRSARRRLLDAWLGTDTFQRFGLDRGSVRERVLRDCRDSGDILTTVFEQAAAQQDKERWAECTPLHLLEMERIKREIPSALFIHVIRDGRDVAMSLDKVGWLTPLPWDRGSELLVGAWVWEWQVRKGQSIGRGLGDAYYEVRFEDLVENPGQTLHRIGDWIGHPLVWDDIRQNAVGVLAQPNTAFTNATAPSGQSFDPVQRWRRQLTARDLGELRSTIGDTLRRLGYPESEGEKPSWHRRATLQVRKHAYQSKRQLQLWLKQETFLSRFFTDPELEDL